MYYSAIKKTDVANGPGVRVSLFVSGCRNHCEDCFNAETWNFLFGKEFTDETIDEIIEALRPSYIQGFSLLGGDPFEEENQEMCTKLLDKIKQVYGDTKDIWAWTGYTFEKDLMNEHGSKLTEYTYKMVLDIDVLVDGRFVKELKDLSLAYRGSSNQRVIDLKKTFMSTFELNVSDECGFAIKSRTTGDNAEKLLVPYAKTKNGFNIVEFENN